MFCFRVSCSIFVNENVLSNPLSVQYKYIQTAIPSMDTSAESVRKVGKILIDQNEPLASRFRALFTLRNLGGQAAIDCISAGFADPSALLKHECAYCLGQMQDEGAIPALQGVLRDEKQETIVRHEAGKSLLA